MNKTTSALLSMALLLGGAFPATAQDSGQMPEQTLTQRIDELIEKLADEEYATREAAQKELESIGRAALPALQKAATSEDPEVASRAGEAIARIRKLPGTQTREKESPDQARPRGPTADQQLKEFRRQVGKMFDGFFNNRGQKQPNEQPEVDEERRGDNWQSRVRVWTWNNRKEKAKGNDPSANLGVQLGPTSAVLRAQLKIPGNEGVVVNRISSKGWAAERGIKLYDVIVALDGRAVRRPRDLTPLVAKGGKLELYREAKLVTLELPAVLKQPKPGEKSGENKPAKKERSF